MEIRNTTAPELRRLGADGERARIEIDVANSCFAGLIQTNTRAQHEHDDCALERATWPRTLDELGELLSRQGLPDVVIDSCVFDTCKDGGTALAREDGVSRQPIRESLQRDRSGSLGER